MAGIYIHIPFCKQKCSYCDFHFSTNTNLKTEMVNSIIKELEVRKSEINEEIETLYLGGGTPSLLSLGEINAIFEILYKYYTIKDNAEITLESNPDDLSINTIKELKSTAINRLSIGVQSFFEDDLQLMNRAHNAQEAINSIKSAQDLGFENITIDLIYGSQTTTDQIWEKNLEIAIGLNVPHISSYALTIEPKTLLAKKIERKLLKNVDETKQERQFKQLVETLTENNFTHYEISNFGKEGFISQHNSNYWRGKSYLGIGPSAHSFNGKTRSWNISNNAKYIKGIHENRSVSEIEVLNENDIFNEMIMIGLRTIFGVNLDEIKIKFPFEFHEELQKEIQPFLQQGFLQISSDNSLTLTKEGKFLADGIAAQLFRV